MSSELRVDKIIPTGGVPTGGGGGIIQVVSAYKGDSFSTSSTSFVDITGLSMTSALGDVFSTPWANVVTGASNTWTEVDAA